jgi:thiol-disulfide isomerase/thioredoxin
MKRIAAIALPVTAIAVLSAMLPDAAAAADAPAERVLAMYFHRTERCPTCRKMGTYAEEAVKTGFAEQVKDGTVAFYYVDFQDPKNAKLAKGYDVSGPALIVAKIRGKKVKEFKDLEDIWTNVADKPAFIKYVRENVSAYVD